MNPTCEDPTAPPPPLPPPRSSFSCDHHQNDNYTGFCAACLCERLTSLDQSSSNTASSSRRPPSSSKINNPLALPLPKASVRASFPPELRRSQSFSASKNEALGLSFEPQRKSCDVRVRNTLWSLFSLEDEKKTTAVNRESSSSVSCSYQCNFNVQKTESFVVNGPLLEEGENEDDFIELKNTEYSVSVVDCGGGDDRTGIRASQDSNLENLRNVIEVETNNTDTVGAEAVSVNNWKPMKDHMNIGNQEKKSSGGGFWAAASVFSKKWQKWRQKHKVRRQRNGKNLPALPVEKTICRQYRETQSEIADYGFGRRSCDTDPRFSLDAGRFSLDGPRYSFDEPRASWDGYLNGKTFPRVAPMLSVMEDSSSGSVLRSNIQMLVDEPIANCLDQGEVVPGGSAQTREYYSDSSSKRRRSLDRSNSIRRTAAAVVAEIDELELVSNAKVSPATMDCFHGAKVLVGESGLRDLNSNSDSLRDDFSETFDLGSRFRGCSNSVISQGERKESKKSRRWSWRILGFIYRRSGGSKDEDEDGKSDRLNGTERSVCESWQDLKSEGNGHHARDEFSRNISVSSSSTSLRNNNHLGGSFGSAQKSSVKMDVHGTTKRDDCVLERNRSARYCQSHIDNGLLRFYLTPMRSSRRLGTGKMKSTNSHSIRNVLRLY